MGDGADEDTPASYLYNKVEVAEDKEVDHSQHTLGQMKTRVMKLFQTMTEKRRLTFLVLDADSRVIIVTNIHV